jgi:hypothetical protein
MRSFWILATIILITGVIALIALLRAINMLDIT